MTILICEDEEIMLAALSFRLRQNGFEVIAAENGREALNKIKEFNPDIIVTDIMMPYITGTELLNTLRREMQSNVPVIIISTLDQEEVILSAFQRGANDFIVKPFKPNELIIRIKKIIQEQKILS